MNIYIHGDYHRHLAHAEQDKQNLEFMFGKIGSGMETVHLSNWREYRATHHINSDDYIIEKK